MTHSNLRDTCFFGGYKHLVNYPNAVSGRYLYPKQTSSSEIINIFIRALLELPHDD